MPYRENFFPQHGRLAQVPAEQPDGVKTREELCVVHPQDLLVCGHQEQLRVRLHIGARPEICRVEGSRGYRIILFTLI